MSLYDVIQTTTFAIHSRILASPRSVTKDYVRLLKYADSMYRCKQLKRAALGRICTMLKRLAPSLAYLEQVVRILRYN